MQKQFTGLRTGRLFSVAAPAITLLLTLLTILVGMFLMGDRKYYFVSLLIACYTIAFFCLVFERGRPRAREIVVISVMIAIAVLGRAIFFMIPQFKPMVAIVIISGAALGAESGFIVGALTAFISNFLFGQGPWTPWQMFSLGVIGFLAGLIFEKHIGGWSDGSRRNILCVFGAFSAFFLYGGIVDLWRIFSISPIPSIEILISVYGLAVPFNLIHAAATVFFLFFLSNPLLNKLDRVKLKFGLLGK